MSSVISVEETSQLTFAEDKNFLDPQFRTNGEPYAPWKYKQLVKELYIISKNIHTSYTELLDISPTERDYLIQFIVDDMKKSEEDLSKIRAAQEAKQQKAKSPRIPKNT